MTELMLNTKLSRVVEADGEWQISLHPADYEDLLDDISPRREPLGGFDRSAHWYFGTKRYRLNSDPSCKLGWIKVWRLSKGVIGGHSFSEI